MAQKPPQVLTIEPAELRFVGPFQDVVTTYLRINNPSGQRVCYKVKTTAPRRYCVRPNCGFLEPGGHVDVSVMLQPREPGIYDKTKHKFMVQSMYAPESASDVDALWATAAPGTLMDTKIKCIFEGEGADEVVKIGRDDAGSDSGVRSGTFPDDSTTTAARTGQMPPGRPQQKTQSSSGTTKIIVIVVIALILGLAAAYVMMAEE